MEEEQDMLYGLRAHAIVPILRDAKNVGSYITQNVLQGIALQVVISALLSVKMG